MGAGDGVQTVQSLRGLAKSLASNPSEMGSPWRFLSEAMTGSALCFNRIVLAVLQRVDSIGVS